MLNIIKNELFKILASRKLYIFIIIVTLITGGASILFKSNKVPLGFEISAHNFPVMALVLIVTPFIPLFLIVLVAAMFTEEYTNGTLKLSLLRPISRGKLLMGKVAALLITIIALQLFIMFLAYIIGFVVFPGGEVFVFEKSTFTIAEGIFRTIGSYLFTVLPLFSFSMLILLLVINFNSSGGAVGAGMGLFVLLDMISGNFQQIQSYVINTYFRYFQFFFVEVEIEKVLISFAIIMLYALLPYMISRHIFKKKDILN